MKIRIDETLYKGQNSLRIGIKTVEHNEGYEYVGLECVFNLLKYFFIAEDYRYPQEKGLEGRQYLRNAINDLCEGMDIKDLFIKYQFNGHGLTEIDIHDPRAQYIIDTSYYHKEKPHKNPMIMLVDFIKKRCEST